MSKYEQLKDLFSKSKELEMCNSLPIAEGHTFVNDLDNGNANASILFVGEAPGCLTPNQYVTEAQPFLINEPIDRCINTNGLRQEVLKDLNYDYQGTVFEIKTQQGYYVEVTPHHKILAIKSHKCYGRYRKYCFPSCYRYELCSNKFSISDPEWVEARHIRPDDHWCVIPKIKNTNTTNPIIDFDSFYKDNRGRSVGSVELDEDLAWIFGLYMAEGYSSDGMHFSLGIHETEIANIVIDKIRGKFPSLNVVSRENIDGNTRTVNVFNRQISYWIKEHFGTRANNKKVPLIMDKCSNRVLKEFLYAWYLGDGNHLTNLNKSRRIATSSKIASLQAVYYLLKLEILPTYGVYKCKPSKLVKSETVMHYIGWRNSDCHKISDKLPVHNKKPRIVFYEGNKYFYVPVKEVTQRSYIGRVYDMTTEDNSYSVPFIIHNSKEDLQGIPFVGDAGKILDENLENIGLTRKDVWIGNVVRFRPTKNNGKSNRPPTQNEIDACLPLLEKEIEIVNPKVIVTLGRVPLKALTGNTTPMSQITGEILKYKSIPLVAMYHPAALIYNKELSNKIRQDFVELSKLLT